MSEHALYVSDNVSDDLSYRLTQPLSIAKIVDIVDELVKPFKTEIPIIIHEKIEDMHGMFRSVNESATGAVFKGTINLFSDKLFTRQDVELTLWHEMLHFGLKRFIDKDDYIAKMKSLYDTDLWIEHRTSQWLNTTEAKRLAHYQPDILLAKGTEEALASLAEVMMSNSSGYQNNTVIAKTKRAVASWVSSLASEFGFDHASKIWQSYAAGPEARNLITSIFAKLKSNEMPCHFYSNWLHSDPSFRNIDNKKTPSIKIRC